MVIEGSPKVKQSLISCRGISNPYAANTHEPDSAWWASLTFISTWIFLQHFDLDAAAMSQLLTGELMVTEANRLQQ